MTEKDIKINFLPFGKIKRIYIALDRVILKMQSQHCFHLKTILILKSRGQNHKLHKEKI